ncbi:amidohydrolase [Speluncibacter jeojiensis]|uniref:Amidohydrolase family protein n=1 Tax=Speluncibacter jeojiensis TaxID=2710754 RepID=A0A9X4MAL6_9ACTN|nr:amidohydrolase family protein [Corynebacteriales bacterium D3-21]
MKLDPDAPPASALAIRAGRIVAMGAERDVRPVIGPGTEVLDLTGRALLPGINDSHLHATWLGAVWPRTILGGGGSDDSAGDGAGEDGADPPRLETAADRRAAILRAVRLASELGITSLTEPGLGPGEDDGATGCFSSAVLDEYAALAAEGALDVRVTVLRLFGELDGPSAVADFERGLDSAVPPSDPRWLRIGGVKIFADGIPPMRTAWTHHCYADGTDGGLLVEGAGPAEREENLRRMIALAHARGLQIGVHATGDRTIETMVDAIANEQARDPQRPRHYVIHGDLITPETLDRMAALGVGLNTQPCIAAQTRGWMAGALGDTVAGAAWPLERAFAAGVSVSLSSDAPILTPDWRQGVAAAAASMPDAVRRDPRAAMRRLLRCYTVAPAVQDHAERWKGQLAVGMAADICVLEADPIELTPAELPDVAVEGTVVDGRIVYRRG